MRHVYDIIKRLNNLYKNYKNPPMNKRVTLYAAWCRHMVMLVTLLVVTFNSTNLQSCKYTIPGM